MRLIAWAIAFATGDALAIAFHDSVGPPSRLAAAVIVTAGVVSGLGVIASASVRFPARARAPVRRGLGIALAALLGAALGRRAAGPPPPDPALTGAIEGESPVDVVASVARGPEPIGTGSRLIADLVTVAGQRSNARLAVTIASGSADLAPGETIAFPARVRALRGTSNPGVPDPVLSLRALGVTALATVGAATEIRRLSPAGLGPRRLAYAAHRALRDAIDRVVRGPPAAFLQTAVLGERRGVAPEIEDGFRAAGATHVLSVSGLHLAAVATLLFFVVRAGAARIPGLPLLIDPRAVAALAALPAIAFFTLMTGEAVATERSALMLGLGLAALLIGRRSRPGPTIAATILLLLIFEPLEIFDVSFQLSVASVSGIALCAQPLGPLSARGRGPARRLLVWLWRFGAATLAASAATAPLVAHWFGELVPLAPLGNLALVPLVELGVVPIGLFGAAAGALWAPLGRWPLAMAGGAARLTLAIADLFRAHAPVWVCRSPNALETAAATGAGLLALLALGRAGGRRWLAGGALALALVATASVLARDGARRRQPDLVITFLDVGQGDAAVIEAPGGAALLIDGGGSRDGAFDTGARIVEPFLRARGIGRLDVVALSHPHPDHLNGLFRILQRFSVGAFWSTGDDGHNPQYRALLALAAARAIPSPRPAARPLGGGWLEPLAPLVDDAIGPPPGLTVNDASLVLRVSLRGHAALFPGDLEADGEGECPVCRPRGNRWRPTFSRCPTTGVGLRPATSCWTPWPPRSPSSRWAGTTSSTSRRRRCWRGTRRAESGRCAPTATAPSP